MCEGLLVFINGLSDFMTDILTWKDLIPDLRSQSVDGWANQPNDKDNDNVSIDSMMTGDMSCKDEYRI